MADANINETIKKMSAMSPEKFKAYEPKTTGEAIARQVVELAMQGDKAAIQIVFEALRLSGQGKTEIRIVDK